MHKSWQCLQQFVVTMSCCMVLLPYTRRCSNSRYYQGYLYTLQMAPLNCWWDWPKNWEFYKWSQILSYHTRNNDNLPLLWCRNHLEDKISFLYWGTRIWNSLSLKIRCSKSIPIFKPNLKGNLLEAVVWTVTVVYSIIAYFCRFFKRKRACNQGHRTHSLIFDY